MGDDLASDDEAWMAQVDASDDDDGSVESKQGIPSDGKRKLEDTVDEKAPKPKKQKSREKLLLEAGRCIEEQTAQNQAAFLATALSHYSLLKSTDDMDLLAKNEQFSIKPEMLCTSSKDSLLERIRDSISVKKLKKWKTTGSPCVVVICMSARRAVAILKELSALKVRSAKLFPKNGSLDEQLTQLRTNSFGIAVATPHRLAALLSSSADNPAINFSKTRLVILDSAVSNKQFTVATLPDTAPHCMALLQNHILPQVRRRKDAKLAFF